MGFELATYSEKLRDPRWQKRRLEIMDAAGFKCVECGAGDKTLNVHHKRYLSGHDPWDYYDIDLACLCDDCHKAEHEIRDVLALSLSMMDRSQMETVIGYAAGVLLRSGDVFWSDDLSPRLTHWKKIGLSNAFGESCKDLDEALKRFIGPSFTSRS